MSGEICVKTYPEPEFDLREIIRYAGGGDSPQVRELVESCISEVRGDLSYRVCFARFPISIADGVMDIGFTRVTSRDLAKNLDGCSGIVLFGATVGIGIDRLIARYGRSSPARALVMQAIGAERIESLCDAFNREITRELGCTKPRFSPGYGDLPLELQRGIFSALDCSRRIGLTLNDSMIMSPSKSVTAIIGIGGKSEMSAGKCANCGNKNCSFRSE